MVTFRFAQTSCERQAWVTSARQSKCLDLKRGPHQPDSRNAVTSSVGHISQTVRMPRPQAWATSARQSKCRALKRGSHQPDSRNAAPSSVGHISQTVGMPRPQAWVTSARQSKCRELKRRSAPLCQLNRPYTLGKALLYATVDFGLI